MPKRWLVVRILDDSSRALLRHLERVRDTVDVRIVRAASPAILFVALLPWLVEPVKRELASWLFRDAAMSQYTGWCIRHGVKLYQDVGAPDGPFIHFLHALFQVFAGISDQGCRVADLVFQVVLSGAMGAVLAPAFAPSRISQVGQRLAWGSVGVAMWLPYYLNLGADNTVQRDPYYALVGYLGMLFVFVSAEWSPRAGRLLAFAGGFLTTLMLFSRPFGVIYPALSAIGLLLEAREERASFSPRVLAAGAGGVAAVIVMLGAVALAGSLSGLFFWYVRFPLIAYRFAGRIDPMVLLTDAKAYGTASEIAITILVGLIAAMATGVLPWKALGFSLAPLLFLFAACWTGKGWSNHVVQTTAARNIVLLLVLSRTWKFRADGSWSKAHGIFAVAALVYCAQLCHAQLSSSEFSNRSFVSAREKEAFEVGEYLNSHTRNDDRVFLYGHEAHALLLAERVSAIPYYVNMIFDLQSYMTRLPPSAGQRPTARQMARFTEFQAEIAADGCGRLDRQPPAAMVFYDNSFGVWGIPDGVSDVAKLCPDLRSWLHDRYTLTSTVGGYHIYLRNDRK